MISKYVEFFRQDQIHELGYREILLKKIETDLNMKLPKNFKYPPCIRTVDLEVLAELNGIDTKQLYTEYLQETTEFNTIEEYTKHTLQRLKKIMHKYWYEEDSQ